MTAATILKASLTSVRREDVDPAAGQVYDFDPLRIIKKATGGAVMKPLTRPTGTQLAGCLRFHQIQKAATISSPKAIGP